MAKHKSRSRTMKLFYNFFSHSDWLIITFTQTHYFFFNNHTLNLNQSMTLISSKWEKFDHHFFSSPITLWHFTIVAKNYENLCSSKLFKIIIMGCVNEYRKCPLTPNFLLDILSLCQCFVNFIHFWVSFIPFLPFILFFYSVRSKLF